MDSPGRADEFVGGSSRAPVCPKSLAEQIDAPLLFRQTVKDAMTIRAKGENSIKLRYNGRLRRDCIDVVRLETSPASDPVELLGLEATQLTCVTVTSLGVGRLPQIARDA